MSAKRHEPPAVPSDAAPAAAAERKRPRPAREAVAIDALPRAVLTEIFTYAPPAARLKAISLVCKRWRTAALHAYDTIYISTPLTTLSALRLAAALALLPCVTSMHIGVPVAHVTLPVSLRKLSVATSYLRIATDAVQCGLDTFLTQHFPNLTELKVAGGESDPAYDLTRFLSAHADQLASLTLNVEEASSLLFLERSSSLRALHKLEVLDPTESTPALIRSITSLRELALVYSTTERFLEMPEDCITALTRLHLCEGAVPECLTRLRLCPNLKELSAGLDDDDDMYQQHRDLLARTAFYVTLASQRWEWLGQFSRLSQLSIPHLFFHTAPERAPFLPHLRTVSLGAGDADERLDPSAALLKAHCVLNALPQVSRLELYVSILPLQPPHLRPCVEALVRAAATQHHVREIVFDSDTIPLVAAGATFPAVECGWLKVSFVVPK